MKKVLAFFAIISISLWLSPINSTTAASGDRYFIVTAYYSPLPNQDRYAMGTYEKEKTMNGEWRNGASWRAVFPGMLAAPGKYGFGTKIYLEGLGVWSVEDRGWAIVEAGKRWYEHDRIDVWMGYGDEGLRRSMYWGKRVIKGQVIGSWNKTSINIKKVPSPLWIAQYIKKAQGTSTVSTSSAVSNNIFQKGIGIKSSSTDIKRLQTFLKEIGFYTGVLDWTYNNELMNNIYDFQIENKLVTNWSHAQAWYWGSATRSLLWKKYLNGDFSVEQKVNKGNEIDLFNSTLSTIEDTKYLQEILAQMNLYNGEINGVYSDARETILTYQLDNKIISSQNEAWAGYFGPKTRASLKTAFKEFKETDKERSEERQKIKEQFNALLKEAEIEAKKEIESFWTPRFAEIGGHVRNLQNTLTKLWYFEYKDTAIFWVKTKNSIIEYQTDKEIITLSSDTGAGTLGPKTMSQLEKDIKEYILKEKLKSSGILDNIEKLSIKRKEQEKEVSTEIKLEVNLI